MSRTRCRKSKRRKAKKRPATAVTSVLREGGLIYKRLYRLHCYPGLAVLFPLISHFAKPDAVLGRIGGKRSALGRALLIPA